MDEQTLTEQITAAAADDKIVTGVNETVTAIQNGDVTRVVLAANCPQALAEQVRDAADDIPVNRSEKHNERLGSVCQKPFTVSVLGLTT